MTDEESKHIVLTEDNPNEDAQETLREIHEHMDALKRQRMDEDPDKSELPEEIGSSVLKYHKSAEISGELEDKFDQNVAFFGSHVVNSNTKRIDNLRHLGELDSSRIVRNIPYLRELGTDIKIETTSEFQMCRSNPEIGGFDQKMGRTNITKEDVDLRQTQTMNKPKKEGGGILGWLNFGRKKET